MPFVDFLNCRSWIPLIEMLGALVITRYVLQALLVLLRSSDVIEARLLIAEGAIVGLSLKLAGTLLKTILLHSWTQIGMFVAILALRTLLKQLFSWERAGLLKSRPGTLGNPARVNPARNAA
jgi:hypothetical protein